MPRAIARRSSAIRCVGELTCRCSCRPPRDGLGEFERSAFAASAAERQDVSRTQVHRQEEKRLQTTIGRLSGVEFFAAMPPGVFVFLVAYVCLSPSLSADGLASLSERLLPLSRVLQENPPMVVGAVFGSYLFGSIIRSLPVRWADSVASFRRDDFPYPAMLARAVAIMKTEYAACGIDPRLLPEWTHLSAGTFNYWKDVLCLRAPAAFSFYQSYEARSRFFAGMFWAGMAGVVGGLYLVVSARFEQTPYTPALQLLIASVVLVVAFGFQLRRVREQEARVLVTLFAALLQDERGSKGDRPANTRLDPTAAEQEDVSLSGS